MTLKKIAKNILIKLDKYSPKPLLYSFVMSKDEIELFDREIKNSRAILEFGMGGSTIRALQKSKAKICSIDSSLDWIREMREYFPIKYMEGKRLTLVHVDVGPTGGWGWPVGEETKDRFPDYSSHIFNIIDKSSIDTVLVDGRFRVACALKTILECHENDNLRIMIHDFWDRTQYHVVLKYLDVADCADTLGAFTLKKDIDLESVKKDYECYKNTPE